MRFLKISELNPTFINTSNLDDNMIIVNTDFIPGKTIAKTLGLVRGNTVRAKWIGADIISTVRNVIGGRLTEYEDLLTQAREAALQEMVHEAQKLDADAVINVRFMTSQIAQGAAEILVYGTAVKLKSSK